MKLKFLHLFFILLFKISFSQNIIVKYNENRIISKEKLEEMPEIVKETATKINHYVLYYKNGISLYKQDSTTTNIIKNICRQNEKTIDSLQVVEITIADESVRINNIEKYFYKVIQDQLVLFELYNGDRKFHGKDTFQKWNWIITDEKKEINGYECKKAKCNWLGYDFTAWYSEDIPINAGPEKFDGLPGLIFYVGTPYYEYSVTSISFKENFEIKKPIEKIGSSTLTEINDYISGKIKGLKNTTTTTQEDNSTITRKTIIIN